MKKVALVVVVVAGLATAPSVLASSGTTKACNGTQAQRPYHYRVHDVSCSTVFKDGGFAPNDPFKCTEHRKSGSTITHIKCVNRKQKSHYFTYQVAGSL